MKKFSKIAVIILVLCLVFSVVALTGCGEQGPQGEKGDKGETGAVGPQGPKGDKGDDGVDGVDGVDGDDGVDGATAFEMYKAWYLATYEMEYTGTEADFYASILNDNIYVHNHTWAGGFFADLGTAIAYYQKCADCLEVGNILFVENVEPTTVAAGSTGTEVVFGLTSGAGIAFLNVTVDEANAGKYFNVGLIMGRGQPVEGAEISFDGQAPSNIVSLTEGTHTAVIRYGNHLSDAPAGIKINFEELVAVSTTEAVAGATELAVVTTDTNDLVSGTATSYYFTATTAGVYKISWNGWYGAIYESEDAYNNWASPLADFSVDAEYIVVMEEGAVFNCFIEIPEDESSFLYIEQIA